MIMNDFKGGRGLRQGDPISLYLFTIVMEMHNVILKAEINKEKLFKYHFGCKQLHITHLCFADGLLVLCHGDVQSVKTIKKPLKNSVLFLVCNLIWEKIGVADCKVLIDKVNQKLGDWENKNLTYAGRAQLIASVLSSMHVYWGSVILLPKTIINDTERIFKRFLWSSGDNSKGRVKIAWSDVKWIHVVKLKGRNVWDVDIQKNESWGWKSILGLREIHKNEIFYAGFSDNNNVADLIDTNGWKWPAKWKEKYRFLNNIPIPQLTNNPDTSVWISNDGKEGKFSTNRMWKDVRRMNNKVEWNDIVWHSNCIPRHNFVLWMAIQNKICTQDKLAKWYPNNTYCCSLCKKEGDTHDHLFFNCDYAMELWEKVKDKAKMCGFATNWKDIVIEISKWKSKRSVWGTIRKLCFAAAVYYLWQERNRRTLVIAMESKVHEAAMNLGRVVLCRVEWARVHWKMAKRSYRDGWAIVIVDDASYRRLHWCFVRKGAAKITSVLSEVVAAFDLIAYLHEGNVAYIECFSSVRPVWCCDYRSSTLDDLYDAIL
ncbi:RNA-directed DNA polymerase, eukaryota, reverse transcriptase zinc-binding domain protein [Tanacetum coccineum]